MKRKMSKMGLALIASTAVAAVQAFGAGNTAAAASESQSVISNRTVGYVLTDYNWAMYQTKDGKAECPQGYNDGPREQFKILFPDDGTKRTLLETQLARESATWHPDLSPEPYAFKEASGKTAIGLNLDGKTGPNDFTSPDGENGIDNQLWRALGCIANYRGPDGTLYHFINKYMQQYAYNRMLMELTNVDNLTNDDDVTVTLYRGLDGLLTDATGNKFMPGGTQRADMRWGKQFISKFHGKIVDGVLTTDAQEMYIPSTWAFEDVTMQHFHGATWRLQLTPDGAQGLLGGYVDVEGFYRQGVQSVSTHHQSYGQQSAPSLYRALHKLADGYPDPATGQNTGISSAMEVKFTQVFIQHPRKEVASAKPVTGAVKPAIEVAGER